MTEPSPAGLSAADGLAAAGRADAVPYLPPGAMLGNYKLLGGVAAGGFGLTYVARDMALARNVAIKECFPMGICRRNPNTGEILPLSPQLEGAYLQTMEDMRREARFLASLDHERIVRIFEVFESQGSLFYAMPWLPGGSLRKKMAEARKTGRPVSGAQAMHWLCLLLEGLQYLHGKRLIHRDIKPENILFDERDLPVLVDFGAALQCSERTQEVTMGAFSPGYAAPEQVLCPGKAGPWTDLYSLAATWHELLTGQKPEMSTDSSGKDGLQRAEWVPCPAALRKSILRNLSLQPGDRCQSCAQWLAELRKGGVLPGVAGRGRLLGAAACVLLAGGALLAWLLQGSGSRVSRTAAPADAAAPAPAALQAVRAELLRKEREFVHLDGWIREMSLFCDKLQAQGKAWQQEAQQWGEQSLESLRKSPADPHLEARRRQELKGLRLRFQESARSLEREYADILRRNPLQERNELQAFPVGSVEEAAWKAGADQELYDEAGRWEARPALFFAELYRFDEVAADYEVRCQKLGLELAEREQAGTK